MNKLTMAHDFALRGIDMGVLSSNYSLDLLVAHSWQYADLMLAEDEKRKDKGLPEVLKDAFVIDWGYAPAWANWWSKDKCGTCFWHEYEPTIVDDQEWYADIGIDGTAESFNYQGDWKQSLRKRPE